MMNPTPTQTKAGARYRGLIIIWSGILITIFIFITLTWALKIAYQPGNDALRFQFFDVLGGATFALSFVGKYLLLRRARATQRAEVVTTAYVVAFALCEMTALFGLLNYLLSGVPIFLLFALALIGLLLHFPRRASFASVPPLGSADQGLNNSTY
jgi:hypothetical protein